MYTEDEFLQLSGIQHFSFCKRQWALIHIEQQWNENILTAEGRVEHKRVHDNSVTDLRNGKLTIRGLKVHSNKLGVSGECDAVEFIEADEGITLYGRNGKWSVFPVEYKHGSSKVNDCDRLQTVIQALCLEEMFSCHIEKAYIFYFDNRRREEVDLTNDLRSEAENMLAEMHQYMKKSYTPKVKTTNSCKKCSLMDLCVPQLQENKKSVTEYIKSYMEDAHI